MRQIPLRGGPLDGKTVPATSIHSGRYTEHRIPEIPRVAFDPGHDPTGPIKEVRCHRGPSCTSCVATCWSSWRLPPDIPGRFQPLTPS